jgi:hypothetical protein
MAALYVRRGGDLVPADPPESALADTYQDWPDKGEPVDGRRLSIRTARDTYRVGEPVPIVHAVEILEPGHDLYVMGPKPVLGEWVDGTPAGPPAPDRGDPLDPGIYDGRVLPSPGYDVNYDVTVHTFAAAGTHTVQWRLGDLASNVLTVHVAPGA